MIKSIVWSSTIDYSNQVSTVLFVDTCNWRCEYCHNHNLISKNTIDFSLILPQLIKRKDFIDHIIISGGECTCCVELEEYINVLKNNGFKVGIHTNGSNPVILNKLINKLDFIGMDIKTSFKKYKAITQCNVKIDDIIKSVNIIKNSGINSEYRTTVYPKYVTIEDCISIATFLQEHSIKEFVLQQFDNTNLESKIQPYSKNYLENIVLECNKIISTTLRGY